MAVLHESTFKRKAIHGAVAPVIQTGHGAQRGHRTLLLLQLFRKQGSKGWPLARSTLGM
jgi:hypothetical protein